MKRATTYFEQVPIAVARKRAQREQLNAPKRDGRDRAENKRAPQTSAVQPRDRRA
jgi:hypothetical protein